MALLLLFNILFTAVLHVALAKFLVKAKPCEIWCEYETREKVSGEGVQCGLAGKEISANPGEKLYANIAGIFSRKPLFAWTG